MGIFHFLKAVKALLAFSTRWILFIFGLIAALNGKEEKCDLQESPISLHQGVEIANFVAQQKGIIKIRTESPENCQERTVFFNQAYLNQNSGRLCRHLLSL